MSLVYGVDSSVSEECIVDDATNTMSATEDANTMAATDCPYESVLR